MWFSLTGLLWFVTEYNTYYNWLDNHQKWTFTDIHFQYQYMTVSSLNQVSLCLLCGLRLDG
jgi:hypothetical protein